jgi:hypothetical protein
MRYPRMELAQKLAAQKENDRKYRASPRGKLRRKLHSTGLTKKQIDEEINRGDSA